MKFVSALTSKRRYVWITILLWVIVAGFLSVAPSANDYAINTGENDLPKEAQSVIAEEKVQSYFPDDSGQLAILVFSSQEEWTKENWGAIANISEWMTDEETLSTIDSVVPFHRFPEEVREEFRSEDGQTMVLPVTLKKGLEMDMINETINEISTFGNDLLDEESELYITGPAGIASDTLELFANANLTLLFSTIGLVLVLLIVIYRSPLLAIIPLIAVGFVYQVVDRVLGLLAANNILTIETQSLSIVMILLFGATTDYSLFIFSRYREELRVVENKFEAMGRAVRGIAEPIFFSGGTVLAAMLVLLLAHYGPYQNFAPTFAITIVFVLLAGLTLIPALFTLVGRKAFWPSIPKLGEETLQKNKFWSRIGSLVTKKPWLSGGIVLTFLVMNALNVPSIQYSFNLINSFPEDMNSRVGFEKLEDNFPPGELAPVTVLLETKEKFELTEQEWEKLQGLQTSLEETDGVFEVSLPSLEELIEDSDQMPLNALTFELILNENPYDQSSLDVVDHLTETSEELLEINRLALNDYSLYFAGESAKQADVRAVNDRDTLVVAIVITLVIIMMLMWHTKSLIAPIYMMGTILLSYLSALGLSWFLFQQFLGYEAMSYRIPLYSFVFLVALGVDYNIMLISRIREENQRFDMHEAVRRGVTLTGGVISSAGLILAATFAVLMTQPIMELFMFGFIVGLGIILDAFIVRGILVPAIVTLLGKWNWWPASKDLK